MSADKPIGPVSDQPPAETPSRAEAIAKIVEMKRILKQQELTSGPSGAPSLSSTAQILDATGVSIKNPDKRYRWVSVSKAMRRQVEGYERVPEVDGGRQVGSLILMALPREVYDARVAAIVKRNKDRLTAHNREMEEAAEALAKYVRDSTGKDVRAEDLLVKG